MSALLLTLSLLLPVAIIGGAYFARRRPRRSLAERAVDDAARARADAGARRVSQMSYRRVPFDTFGVPFDEVPLDLAAVERFRRELGERRGGGMHPCAEGEAHCRAEDAADKRRASKAKRRAAKKARPPKARAPRGQRGKKRRAQRREGES